MKGKHAQVARRAREYEALQIRLSITTLTIVEVVRGYCRKGNQAALDTFLDQLPQLDVIGFDSESAVLAGRIYSDLDRTGRPIGRMDPMIAAVAVRHGTSRPGTRHGQCPALRVRARPWVSPFACELGGMSDLLMLRRGHGASPTPSRVRLRGGAPRKPCETNLLNRPESPRRARCAAPTGSESRPRRSGGWGRTGAIH